MAKDRPQRNQTVRPYSRPRGQRALRFPGTAERALDRRAEAFMLGRRGVTDAQSGARGGWRRPIGASRHRTRRRIQWRRSEASSTARILVDIVGSQDSPGRNRGSNGDFTHAILMERPGVGLLASVIGLL